MHGDRDARPTDILALAIRGFKRERLKTMSALDVGKPGGPLGDRAEAGPIIVPRAQTSAPVALVVDRLEKRFGQVVAIKDISLTVQRGEFLSLLGPSGSGKTTILRMIGGLEYPTSGRITLNGRDVQGLPPYRRNIGVVFQKYALFPHMTAAENIEFPLKRHHIARGERKLRIATVLDLVGLTGLGDRYPTELSGGQEQRVALARAIVFEPEVLLLDEPLGALDKQLRERMQREIRSLQAQLGITTIFVTHDQTEAMAMSDRIAVINHGLIEQIDTPEALYERPATEFVAGFVGDSNVVPCELLETRGCWAAVRLAEGVVIEVPTREKMGAAPKLLLRPERIRLVQRSDQPRGNSVRGKIVARTYFGDVTVYAIAAGSLTLMVKQPHQDEAARPGIGEQVTACWDPSDGVLVG